MTTKRRKNVTRKVKARRDKRSAPFGFDKWNLECENVLEEIGSRILSEVMPKLISEGMKLATADECHAWFPFEWNFGDNPSDGVFGRFPKDPTTIYVELPLGEHEDDSPRWSFTLRELVKMMIEGAIESDGKIGVDYTPAPIIRDSLRELADEIDRHLRQA